MKQRGAEAFTLVEVVLALSVLSFCLVILLGLFNVGLTNGRRSSDDTMMASMVMQVSNALRTQTIASGYQTNLYFDVVGQPLSNSTGAQYLCAVTAQNTPASQAPSPLDTNLVLATLRFTWPASVAHAPHTNVVYATLPPP